MSRALRWVILGVVTAAVAVVGWRLMCTSFLIHDDEGYVLISFRNFSIHGRLYDDVFTQYGPAPFLYYDGLHRLFDVPIDNLLGRVATTCHWVGAALAAGLIAWRLSGRYWTALFTLVATFGYLWQMTWEPAHPGGLIAVVAAGGLAAALALLRDRTQPALVLLGAVGAVLCFTKINVGLFWCCSLGAFLLMESDGGGRRGAWLAASGLALLPFALMRPLLGDPSVRNFAIMFALSGVALCLPLGPKSPQPLRRGDWLAAAAGWAGASVIIVVATLAHGTTIQGLWHGVVLAPLRHPVNFHLGFSWLSLTWVIQAVTLSICGLWCAVPRWRAGLRDVAAGLRLLALAALVWKWDAWIWIEGLGALIRLGLPMLPLFLLPLAETSGDDRSGRAMRLAAFIGAGQVLHAYPVAGSQLAWGSFLLLPLLVTGLVDAAAHLAQRLRGAWLSPAVAALALTTTGAQLWLLSDQSLIRWNAFEPLGLPGARFLRSQEDIRYALRIVSANARLHADMLFSKPGMFGFNLWTNLPTPTLRNATHWFWLLSADEQQEITARLQAARRPAFISSRPLLDLLHEDLGMTVTGPLNDYLVQHYRPLFTVTGYTFHVPTGSAAVPFFVAQNFRPGTGDAPAMVAVNVAAQAEVACVVLRDVREPHRPLVTWGKNNSQVTLLPIDANGRPGGETRMADWPVRFQGLQQMRLYHRSPLPSDRPQLELVFLDAQGRTLFEACYDPEATVSLLPAGG